MVPFRAVRNREHRSRLQGTKEWDRLWDSLVIFADSCGLDSVQLDVNLPSLHEEFFASWDRRRTGGGRLYRADIPLCSPSHGSIGSLRIAGRCTGESTCSWIGQLIEGLRPFEEQIAELIVIESVELPAHPHIGPHERDRTQRPLTANRPALLGVPAVLTASRGYSESAGIDAL